MAGSAEMPHQRWQLEQGGGGGTGENTEEVSMRWWWWGEARRKERRSRGYINMVFVIMVQVCFEENLLVVVARHFTCVCKGVQTK